MGWVRMGPEAAETLRLQAREALLEGAKSGKLAEAGLSGHMTSQPEIGAWGVKGQVLRSAGNQLKACRCLASPARKQQMMCGPKTNWKGDILNQFGCRHLAIQLLQFH